MGGAPLLSITLVPVLDAAVRAPPFPRPAIRSTGRPSGLPPNHRRRAACPLRCGSGNARRSSLPLEVTGNASRKTKAAGRMWIGS
jgi:hypothetical protein